MIQETNLHDICPCSEPEDVFVEIRQIINDMDKGFDFEMLDQLHIDIQNLFQGNYPGYQASNTKYHDLKHTYAVVLAMVRILDSLRIQGQQFTRRHINLGICCAFFHDSGLIQQETDQQGTGAKYTIGHEERSINLMETYLAPAQISKEELGDCAQVIRHTILNGNPQELKFHDPIMGTIGLVLGTADLLAQMSDRHYLEKLPDLFNEFQEGGLPGYATEMEIIRKTEEFYHSVALKRLTYDLNEIGQHLHLHFQQRWGIDRDLYTEAIDQNITYLQELREHCLETEDCYRQFLRRGSANKSS